MCSSHLRESSWSSHALVPLSARIFVCGAPLLALEKCKLQTPISVKSQRLATECTAQKAVQLGTLLCVDGTSDRTLTR